MKIFSDSCWFSISIFTTSHCPSFISRTLVPCSTHHTHTRIYTPVVLQVRQHSYLQYWTCSTVFEDVLCLTILWSTLLSRASAHGCSQLKRQKLRVGGYTEKVLESFNYPHARAHPRCEVNCQDVPHRRFMLRRGQPDSGESCIMLQSWPTHSLIAKFPQRSVVVCSTQISCCRERTLQTRLQTGVCEPLTADDVASKAQ